MAIQVINPAGLMRPRNFAHVSVATGGRIIHLAGQTAHDAKGKLVGVGDLAAQTAKALENVSIALEAAGATVADIVKLTLYIVGWKPELMPALVEGWSRVPARLELDSLRPSTLVGVQTLVEPDILIEIDVVAVVA